MDLQPLPENVLEKQVCANCLQYLSVLPVNINKNGDTFCGRCNVDLDANDQYSKHTVYNIVATHYLFKCINHFEGCKQVLSTNDTINHENQCHFVDHECFICSFVGNWCQVVHHCIRIHPENVTKDGLFHFELGSTLSKQLIFVLSSNIILLTIKITKETFTIHINLEAKNDFVINQFAVKFFEPSKLPEAELSLVDYSLIDINSVNVFEKHVEDLVSSFGRKTNIACQILLKQVELSEKQFELERRWQQVKAREVDLNNEKDALHRREYVLDLQQDTMNAFSTLFKNMASYFVCVNCNKLITEEIYCCPINHFYCETCLTSLTCKICNKSCEFTKGLDLSKVPISCDWPGCATSVMLSNYVEHKHLCPLRPYKCPIKGCLQIIYSHKKFKDHWHNKITPLLTEHSIEYDAFDNYECYWLLNSELYHVMVRFIETNLEVIIQNIEVLPNTIKFETFGFSTDWELQQSTDFCGRYQVNSTNMNAANTAAFTKVKISASGWSGIEENATP